MPLRSILPSASLRPHNYLAVQLHSDQGPLSTHDYRLDLQAVPLPDGKTFMHLRYSYGYGTVGRLAMQAIWPRGGVAKWGLQKLIKGKSQTMWAVCVAPSNAIPCATIWPLRPIRHRSAKPLSNKSTSALNTGLTRLKRIPGNSMKSIESLTSR